MSIDLDAIRAAATGATPGPWENRPDTPWGSKVIFTGSGEWFLGIHSYATKPTDGWSPAARERAVELGKNKCADATYIATMDPQTTLSLLDELVVVEHRAAWQQALAEAAIARAENAEQERDAARMHLELSQENLGELMTEHRQVREELEACDRFATQMATAIGWDAPGGNWIEKAAHGPVRLQRERDAAVEFTREFVAIADEGQRWVNDHEAPTSKRAEEAIALHHRRESALGAARVWLAERSNQ